MSIAALVLLALVQGITEFLPISSSGHLILAREFGGQVGLATHGTDVRAELVLDVALHVGTLLAVMVYVRNEIRQVVRGLLGGLVGRRDEGWHLAWQVLLATVPIFVIGYLTKDLITDNLRTVAVIGWTTLVFGIVLWLADKADARVTIPEMGYGRAATIGLAQALALIPGVSRSGISMTMGRALGLTRIETTRFALLLSIPTIMGAGTLAGLDLYRSGDAQLELDALIGSVLAFFGAWAAIILMMRWLKDASFLPFVIYRVAMGSVLLFIAYA